MDFIAHNWYMILIGLIVLAVAIYFIVYWLRKPSKDKIANLKEWLRLAVLEAERIYGGGTGEIKLRAVYDWAIAKFPWLAVFIKFEQFSQWVDEAIDWMKEKLEDENVSSYVKN